ncbi:MAG: hypothetical protein K2J11_02405 [Oscillospiraceae bacterium]|nr:hypothetical protein [Oscillospiraceae bacterium]
MIELTSKEKFNTSLGVIFIIEDPPLLHKGEDVVIDGQKYKIKRFIFLTRPTDKDIISIVV